MNPKILIIEDDPDVRLGCEQALQLEGIAKALEDDSVIDSEDMGYLGFVTSRRVLRAHAAVARLHQLLEQETR